ncbi:MAG: EutN/CcmL family microcompartment protein [Akkermansiaceae bacterium]
MLHAQIVGTAVATAKHISLEGYKMLLCQQLDAEGMASGTPFVAIDLFGAGMHQKVFVSTDGLGAQHIVKDFHSPIRMFIQGLID